MRAAVNERSVTSGAHVDGPVEPEPEVVGLAPGRAACPGTHHHDGVTNVTQCATCHPKSVTSAGNIIVDSSGNSTHLNGVVDVF